MAPISKGRRDWIWEHTKKMFSGAPEDFIHEVSEEDAVDQLCFLEARLHGKVGEQIYMPELWIKSARPEKEIVALHLGIIGTRDRLEYNTCEHRFCLPVRLGLVSHKQQHERVNAEWEIGNIPPTWFKEESRVNGLPGTTICVGREEIKRYLLRQVKREEYEIYASLSRSLSVTPVTL